LHPLLSSFQNQVFLEGRDCASRKLKNQTFARAVSGWFLESIVLTPVAFFFQRFDYFLFARDPTGIFAERSRRTIAPCINASRLQAMRR
jgi:hypothetical protein